LIDHVTIGVTDSAASSRFYARVLGRSVDGSQVVGWRDLTIDGGAPRTERLHLAFGARDREQIDAWWHRLIAAGYPGYGVPGLRREYGDAYYGAFVLDPDGNSVELVHHQASRAAGIDHLWIRTRDLAALRAFYQSVALPLGLRFVHESQDRIRLQTGGGSITFVEGSPQTANVHIALTVNSRDDVDSFQEIARVAGYRLGSSGRICPGRAEGAYRREILDPDGHSIEAVYRSADARRPTEGAVAVRQAVAGDGEAIARLHAASWRRHYRGAYSAHYLDSDLETERLRVWGERLQTSSASVTLVAEDYADCIGFVHVRFDADDKWGALIDNLHVSFLNQRRGVGSRLLEAAAQAVLQQRQDCGLYLWVQEQNMAAQAFYLRSGGRIVERAPVPPPVGDRRNLDGTPFMLRVMWVNAHALLHAVGDAD
jgi:catechol 2,3-dioxygenase-like lactoylglutathione lyase family enzyme